MLKEFKEFAMRGNMVDMAVGIIMGAAFGTVIKSLVSDVIMPPIGLMLGKVDFSNLFVTLRNGATAGPYGTLETAREAGAVTLNYGVFLNEVIALVIVALAVFVLVKNMNRLRKEFEEEQPAAAPTTKDCPECFSSIPIKARRCPHCTSELAV
ncbi:MAG: large-conductance mechanosensitive channel protein MscL [Acidobacteriota bacterium]